MHNATAALLVLSWLSFAATTSAQIEQAKTLDAQVEEALSALPESMRDDATVKGFDGKGQLVVLREGTGSLQCRADDPSVRAWVVTCYPDSLEAFVARSEELTKAGSDTPARVATLAAEIDSGALEMPDIGVIYMRSGNSVSTSSAVTLIHVPNADATRLGLPSVPTRGAPWMAESGTPMAHIRVGRR